MKTTLNYRSRAKTTLDYRRGEQITPIPVAEAAGESHFPTILLWHSQGRRKGDPKHKCCGKNMNFITASDGDKLLMAGPHILVLHVVAILPRMPMRPVAIWRPAVCFGQLKSELVWRNRNWYNRSQTTTRTSKGYV